MRNLFIAPRMAFAIRGVFILLIIYTGDITMKIKLFDLCLEFDAPITVYDAARSAEKIDRSVIAAKVDGKVVALNHLIENAV